ncbi:MAG: ADP-ribosylglycohydrolase family protein [Syntrophales bacterium]|nr:ADP-ribosylglycohydrolase family protein [Syntrophales bacterium]
MIGAIAGDMIGSVYEHAPIKDEDFILFHPQCRFTDDTVMTLAVAYALLTGTDYATAMKKLGRKYPRAGYGRDFYRWIFEPDVRPYFSFGNGAAMRVSPIGWYFDTQDQILEEAKKSAEVSHNHPEGIKGAQALAYAIFLARRGVEKETIRREISSRFGYNLSRTVSEIRPHYQFDVSCQGSVPEAIICALEADNYETSIRKAVSLGGDSDTLACMAGALAEALYGPVPTEIEEEVKRRLPSDLMDILHRFTVDLNRLIR